MTERDGIFDALSGSAGGLTVSELVGVVGVSDSQVRRKLAALIAAGAVATLKDDPEGPGRPTLRFRLAPTTSAWPELVRILVTVVGRDREHDRELMELARERGAAIGDGGFPGRVVDAMATLGFSPRDRSSRRDVKDDACRLSFQNCPYRGAVRAEGGRVICAMHRGMLEGVAGAVGAEVDEFVPRDPIAAGCEARLRVPSPT